jgi:general secretion pathway protein D
VWIKGNRGAFIRCLEVTRTIDVPEAEIEVKVEMYEVSSSVLHNIGLRLPQVVKLGIGQSTSGGSIMWSDWISNATSKSVRAIIADGSFRADMQSQNQYIGTLSSPTLRVQDGQRARIFVGDKTPVFQTTVGTGGFASESVSYVDTGIKLELDAKIVPNNSILLSLTLDATELGAPVTTVSGSSANRITSRNTVTRLTIEDGQTILLGGYLSKSKSLSRDGMPFLGQTDLAFIGGNRTSANIDRELVMFVTPKIVRSKVFPSKRIMTTLGMDAQRSSPVVIKPGSVSGGVSSGGGNSGGPSPFTAPPALGSGGGGRSN